MRFLQRVPDGGAGSGVTAYHLIEIKSLLTVALLRFDHSRDAYHSHAFNAVTLWLRGRAMERDPDGSSREFRAGQFKWTPRRKVHRIEVGTTTWALTIRGSWHATWVEYVGDRVYVLTHGRVRLGSYARGDDIAQYFYEGRR